MLCYLGLSQGRVDVEDVEAQLVDDAAQNQATVATMAGVLISCRLGGANRSLHHSDHTTELLHELFILNFATN